VIPRAFAESVRILETRMSRTFSTLAMLVLTALAGTGFAQSLPPAPTSVSTFSSQGFEFSTIGNPGNNAFSSPLRPDWYIVQGRGSVPYTYALARTEVTTEQWLGFVNTFSTQGGAFTDFGQPIRWGAQRDPTYSGPGQRWRLDPANPNAAMVPVWGIDWRESAMLCNWLHNGRSADPATLTHGAYDASTFGYPDNNFFNGFTDQVRRSPGAKFWIPSLDEWIKGAFYDPAQNRWWLSHYGSDTQPVYGQPGDLGAQSSAGLDYYPGVEDYFIPLNAYGTQSPYGLLSTSGGPHEWFEDAVGPSAATGLPTYRLFFEPAFSDISIDGDLIFRAGFAVDYPDGGVSCSIRIASSLPSPSTFGAIFVLCAATVGARPRRRNV
jgi:hypothetical protein